MSQRALERLDDYATGILPESDAADFETALFDEAARGEAREADFLEGLLLSLRFIARHGVIGQSFTQSRVEELARKVRMHVIELEPGRTNVFGAWEKDVEIVVTQLNVDLRGYDRVDVVVERPDGTHVKLFHDTGYDPETGRIYAYCEAPLAAAALLSGPAIARVLAERDGVRTEVARLHAEPRVE